MRTFVLPLRWNSLPTRRRRSPKLNMKMFPPHSTWATCPVHCQTFSSEVTDSSRNSSNSRHPPATTCCISCNTVRHLRVRARNYSIRRCNSNSQRQPSRTNSNSSKLEGQPCNSLNFRDNTNFHIIQHSKQACRAFHLSTSQTLNNFTSNLQRAPTISRMP